MSLPPQMGKRRWVSLCLLMDLFLEYTTIGWGANRMGSFCRRIFLRKRPLGSEGLAPWEVSRNA